MLLVIDIVAIPLCLLAAWVAWKLLDNRRSAAAPAVVRTMAWAACWLLALRGLGTIQALAAPPDDATTFTRLVDPFFLLGGLLFGLVARGCARHEPRDEALLSARLTATGHPDNGHEEV